jgi:formylglycine-generating enzyme required for sulfatase activity
MLGKINFFKGLTPQSLLIILAFSLLIPQLLRAENSLNNPDMVFVKGGCFDMGNNFKEYFKNEQPTHEVCVDDFYISSFEVTQAEWSELIDRDFSHFKGCPKCPVENVSWNSAYIFIEKLNKKTGNSYRLPTEAEWEFAARDGGKKTQWPGSNERKDVGEYTFYHGFGRDKTHPVGLKKPNELGLFDMSGNVSEWVEDWYGYRYYEVSEKDNPKGPNVGKTKVHRGGNFEQMCPERVRTTFRLHDWPGTWAKAVGFRLAHSAR